MTAAYHHTQTAPVYLLLVVVSLAVLALGVFAGGPVLFLVLVSAILLFGAFAFQHLTTQDAGDHLHIEFGPVPLFVRRVDYARIRSVERTRSDPLDGWGIHWIPGRGWIWNLWGRDCVRVRFDDGKVLRIGTDDPGGLLRVLEERVNAVRAGDAT